MTPGEVGRSAFRFRRAAARSLLPIALSLVLAGCASSPVDNEPRARVHVVQRGETLYAIASRYGLDYRDVARWNRLRDPDMIYVGQRLRLFPSSASTTSRAAAASRSTRGASSAGKGASSARSPAPPAVARAAPRGAPPSAAPETWAGVPDASRGAPPRAPAPQDSPPPSWHWPTEGAVVSAFGSESGIPSGVGIGGRLGQPIEAAASGRVVYAGSGLIGYGQLVIIRHNETYLTAYGHNRRLLVQQGQTVVQGQKIAEMGYGPKREPRLHFEIRRNGTPVDPLEYLSVPSRLAGAR